MSLLGRGLMAAHVAAQSLPHREIHATDGAPMHATFGDGTIGSRALVARPVAAERLERRELATARLAHEDTDRRPRLTVGLRRRRPAGERQQQLCIVFVGSWTLHVLGWR